MSSNNSGSSNQAHGSNSTNTDSMSDAVIYSFFANQSNSSQLNDEDLQQIDADGLEEMDLKWQMVMLTMRTRRFLNKTRSKISANGFETIGFNKSKMECYNLETTETKALVAQDRLGYDWSDQAEEGPTNFALMAYTSSCSSRSYSESQLNVGAYKAGLESVEARLDVYKKNEVVFEEDIKILKLDIKLRDNALTELRKEFEKAKKERDDLKLTLEKFENSSKNLSKLLEIQVSDKFKTGVGYNSQVVDSQVFDSQVNDKHKTSEGCHTVPPPYTGNFMPPKPNLAFTVEEEYVFSKLESDSKDENETEFKSKQRKPNFAKVEFVKSNEHVKTPRESVKKVENNNQAKYPRKNSQSHRAVLMKSGLKALNTARQNFLKAAISVNTARPVNTAFPRPTVNCARPASNIFNKAHSQVRRPFNKFTTNKNNNLNEKVNIVKGNVTTAGPKAVGNPQLELQEKGVTDSGCSRHMTGNKSYLSDYEEIDGGFVAFGGDPKGGKITGKDPPRYVLMKAVEGLLCRSTLPIVKHSRMETVHDKDYILLPFLTQDPSFSSSLKNSPDAGFKPLGEEEKKDAKDLDNEYSVVPNTEEPKANQELFLGCDDDPNMPNLEEIVYSDDDEGFDAKADMTNLDTNILVSPTPTTRIHMIVNLKYNLGDINFRTQTRRMTQNVTEHEAMQEELLQFKLQQVWTLMDLPHGKRAIIVLNGYGTRKMKEDCKSKGTGFGLVAQGYTQEEGIDYDEIFAPVARIEAIRLCSLLIASIRRLCCISVGCESGILYGKIDEEVYVFQPPMDEATRMRLCSIIRGGLLLGWLWCFGAVLGGGLEEWVFGGFEVGLWDAGCLVVCWRWQPAWCLAVVDVISVPRREAGDRFFLDRTRRKVKQRADGSKPNRFKSRDQCGGLRAGARKGMEGEESEKGGSRVSKSNRSGETPGGRTFGD
ncbi:retrovirus-related pol polyprotein from transposon TNT 1-94 [Tanacetum coccineum]